MLKINDRNDHNMIVKIFIVSYNDRKLSEYRLDRFDITNIYQLRQTTMLCTQGDFIPASGCTTRSNSPARILTRRL